jgi:arginyl-tRNA synthetase
MLDIISKIKDLVKEAGANLGLDLAVVGLEHPDDLKNGDYSTNVALTYAKALGKPPREIAEQIKVEIIKSLPKEIEKVEVAGAGFINFYLSRELFLESIGQIIKDEDFGNSKIGVGQKVVVEYSSPNIAKPFTIGHLRSTIIGDAVANIVSALGYSVVRDNHLGDWGTQFGKMIVAIKKWGDIEKIKQSEKPVHDLVELYVRFHDEAEKDKALESEGREWFVRLEAGDVEAKEIWTFCIERSLIAFKKIYKELGVNNFDTWRGESVYGEFISTVVKELEDKRLLKESEGATLVFFDGEKLPPLMIKKTDGSTLYATRDLATDYWRRSEYGNDVKIINEVGGEQSLYFKQLFETEKMLGWFNDGDRVHVAHGLYRFKEGKMSTRKGNVIWLEDVIDEAVKRAGEINKETAHEVAIGALKFNDLKRKSSEDIVFDWDEILSLKGDSGPYLQYSYVRAYSIVEKAESTNIKMSVENASENTTNLEKVLYRFPEVVSRAGLEYSPHYISTYLMELASAFSNFYAQGVIVSDAPDSPYKVAVTKAFGIVMKRGLELLGIPVLTRM